MKTGIVFRSAATLILLLGLMSTVRANSISLVPGSNDVTVGSQVSVDITLLLTDSVLGGGFDLKYDPAILGFVSFDYDMTFLTTVADPFLSPIPDNCFADGAMFGGCAMGDGELNGLGFGSFMGITGTHTIGTVVFEALSAGASMLTMMDNDLSLGGFIDFPLGAPIALDFQGTTINTQAPAAVPVPGNGWLMMIGLVGLLMRRHAKDEC